MPEKIDNRSITALAEIKAEGIIGIASSEEEDRMGDVIKSTGWELENFKKNPVIQFAHQYNEPPVGIAKDIRVKDKKLIFTVVFHNITEKARQVGEMFEQGIMKAFSVGFIPKKINEDNYHIIEKAELLEISAVPVPANAGALTLSTKAITSEEKSEINSWVKDVSEEEPPENKEEEKEEKDEEKDEPNKVEETNEDKKEDEKVEESKEGDGEVDEQKEPEAKEPEEKEPEVKEEEKEPEDKEADKEEKGLDIKFTIDDKNVDFDLNKIKKNLMEQLGEKSGRVISKKNRELISSTIEQIETTAEVLHNLLDMSDDSPVVEYPDAVKGRIVEARKSRKKRIKVQVLRKIDKLVGKLLRQYKQNE